MTILKVVLFKLEYENVIKMQHIVVLYRGCADHGI